MQNTVRGQDIHQEKFKGHRKLDSERRLLNKDKIPNDFGKGIEEC